mgnify:CR=1 FL=1
MIWPRSGQRNIPPLSPFEMRVTDLVDSLDESEAQDTQRPRFPNSQARLTYREASPLMKTRCRRARIQRFYTEAPGVFCPLRLRTFSIFIVNQWPMWRNGRRNGLKIAVLAISLLCAAYQTWDSLAG